MSKIFIAICAFVALSHAQDVDESNGVRYLVIGNPGTGKSTLLNGLAGKVLFASGPAFGGGKTKFLQEESIGKNFFMDTPGLADIKLREQAAEAITEALRKGGVYKVLFVITLEAGRVKPADRTTMELVLKAAPITQYGVMINKLEKSEFDMLATNEGKARDHVLASLMNGLDTPSLYFHFNLRNEELAGKKDAALPLDENLVAFVKNVPAIEIRPDEVEAVKVDEFEALTEEFETKIAAMRNDNESLEKAIAEDKAKYDKLIENMQTRNKKLRKDFEARQAAAGEQGTGMMGGLGDLLLKGGGAIIGLLETFELVPPFLPQVVEGFMGVKNVAGNTKAAMPSHADL